MATDPPERLEELTRELGPKGEDAFMTGAEMLVQREVERARAKALAEGKAEGKAESLLLLMERKFGAVAPAVGDRVRAGTDSELDRWLVRILTATTVDELFE
jgi:hypothetical protein